MAKVRKVAARLRKFEKGLNKIAAAIVKEEGKDLVSYIKRTKFRPSGEPGPDYIVSRSGKLERSLKSIVKFKRNGLTLEISMEGVQARILEEGGRTKPHPIVPKTPGGVLAFFWPKVGANVVFKRVMHPGSVFVARRIMERSFEETSTAIITRIENKMLREWVKLVA